jgi:hypothetical protein
MLKSPSDVVPDSSLDSRSERACTLLIEERWRRAPGISMRLTSAPAGVVERPGRTRFDLQWQPGARQFVGPLRCGWPQIPMADGSLQLLIVERLGIADEHILEQLLTETLRVLAEDGRLMVVDTNPWSWLGMRARWQGAPPMPAAAVIVRLMKRLGLEDIESEHTLRLPPLPRPVLERYGDSIDAWCTRVLAVPGCIYAVSGRKRSSNVIAIPIRRDQRSALIAAPEGMRRAG